MRRGRKLATAVVLMTALLAFGLGVFFGGGFSLPTRNRGVPSDLWREMPDAELLALRRVIVYCFPQEPSAATGWRFKNVGAARRGYEKLVEAIDAERARREKQGPRPNEAPVESWMPLPLTPIAPDADRLEIEELRLEVAQLRYLMVLHNAGPHR